MSSAPFTSLDDRASFKQQVDEQAQRIADLKESLAQKEALYLATCEKLCSSENKRIELETSLVSLATSDVVDGLDEGKAKDTFVASNCRAAKLEQEANDLRYKLTQLSSAIADFNAAFNEKYGALAAAAATAGGAEDENAPEEVGGSDLKSQLEKIYLLATTRPVSIKAPASEKGSLQLQVKIELEHERRLRTQQALDEAERRQYVLQRDCDNKTRECQEYSAKIKDLKVKHEARLRQVTEENRRLEKLLQMKETEIMSSEARAKELVMRAEEFEDMFNGQLEVVKRLQTDLTSAYNEKKSLVKEMEALNEMFDNMETRYIAEAVRATSRSSGSDGPDETDDAGVDVEEAAAASAGGSPTASSVLEESCFKEVKTKNGTRMVLSVSKTFMKLRDLILEKKTLEEQVEKMKSVNNRLCSRVNLHEEKLFNITDELNKTWTYVSTLKHQHRQLHTSEQILRAELTEKRQLLAKLREELEYSRESWNIVKKKTADSEREWRALRDEFAARRRCAAAGGGVAGLMAAGSGTGVTQPPSASSESGFSEDGEGEGHSSGTNDDEITPNNQGESTPVEERANSIEEARAPIEVAEDSPDGTDPSQKVDDALDCEAEKPTTDLQLSSEDLQASSGSLDTATQEASKDTSNSSSEDPFGQTFPLFIPPIRFMAEVPPEMLPPLFPSGDENGGLGGAQSSAMAENYQELYQKLVASTARSAALANQLAEMHHKFKTSGGLQDGDDDDDDEVEPRTDDESIVNNEEESEVLISEVDSVRGEEESTYLPSNPAEEEGSENVASAPAVSPHPGRNDHDDEEDEEELEGLGLSPSAIEAALARFQACHSDDSDSDGASTVSTSSRRTTSMTSSPPPDSEDEIEDPFFSPGPSNSAAAGGGATASTGGLANTASTSTVVSQPLSTSAATAFPVSALRVYANMDSLDDSSSDGSDDEAGDGGDNDEEGEEGATAVTRFLIKRLPKQLSKLRNDKAELEDRILDLEQTISNQNQAMLEMERRVDVYKKEAETARKWMASLSLNIGKTTSNESNGSQPKPPDEKEDKNEGDQDGDYSTSAQN